MKYFHSRIHRHILCFLFAVFASACSAEAGFQEPKTEAEWKAFCEAPDSLAKLKGIKDKEQRDRVGSTCFRAPWKKFTPSKPMQW